MCLTPKTVPLKISSTNWHVYVKLTTICCEPTRQNSPNTAYQLRKWASNHLRVQLAVLNSSLAKVPLALSRHPPNQLRRLNFYFLVAYLSLTISQVFKFKKLHAHSKPVFLKTYVKFHNFKT